MFTNREIDIMIAACETHKGNLLDEALRQMVDKNCYAPADYEFLRSENKAQVQTITSAILKLEKMREEQ